MATSGICCGLYRGTFYLKDLSNPNNPLLPLGNAEATITQEMTQVTQENFQSLGGNACEISYPSSVGLDFTLHCTSPENLAMAFLGRAYQKEGAAVPSEAHTVNGIGELIPFESVPNKANPIVVKTGATEWQAGLDYVVTSAGIKIIKGSTIPMGTAIEVSYTHGTNWVIDTHVVGQKTFMMVLDGVNVGGDGERPVVLKAWKVKMAPTDSFALIASEFASISMSGEVLKDDSKVAGSQFMKVEFGNDQAGQY